jgi:hypothetical protein
MSNKEFEFHLPYYKQGDDLGNCLSQCKDEDNPSAAAFLMHAEMLESAAKDLRRAASMAADELFEVTTADTHMIMVRVDETVANDLLEEGFIQRDPFWDEEDSEMADLFEGWDEVTAEFENPYGNGDRE